MKLGLELADDFKGNTDFGFASSLRAAGLNRLGGTAYMRAEIGTTPELEMRFLQPLDAGQNFFIEPAVGIYTEAFDIYDDSIQDEPISSYQRYNRWGRLSLGRMLFQEFAESRIGIHREKVRFDFRSGIPFPEDEESTFDDGYLFVSLGWDSLDELSFPSKGMRIRYARQWHEVSSQATT